MRAQNGYLASQGVMLEPPSKLSGEDVKRLKLMMEKEERKMAGRK